MMDVSAYWLKRNNGTTAIQGFGAEPRQSYIQSAGALPKWIREDDDRARAQEGRKPTWREPGR
ncbi:hypothetical protein EYF80_022409 [Liparis tanakae]|uniref:Uncharacterized protein n=1 Tax=Liparis tanakae TaxID=230148 RepID=A0A4Z2HR93_9TELE|nr:hypothetical protein EYF80_022409 [Liparis tanakae]